MRSLLLAVLLWSLVGCAKKAEPYKRQVNESGATPEQAAEKPKADVSKKPDATEKPNWIRPRPQDRELPADAGGSGKDPWVANPPVAGNGQFPPPAVGQPGAPVVQPPSGGATPVVQQPTRPPTGAPTTPGKRVTRADINEVWVFVENFSLASGKMPPPELVYAALVKEKAAAAELVKSNDIILTGKATRESVWAYERKAPTQGGWIAGHNGPEEVTAAEFARRIRE